MRQTVNRQPYVALRALVKWMVRVWLVGTGRLQVRGAPYVPAGRRPCVLVCNHASRLDTLYLIAALRPRLTICGAKPAYFTTPLRRLLMATANILRVEDHSQFLAECTALLREGRTLLIYPEMRVCPDGLGEFSTWAAEVALENRVPAIPCYLHGTTRGQQGAVWLVAGSPLAPEGDAAALTARFRREILALAAGVGREESRRA